VREDVDWVGRKPFNIGRFLKRWDFSKITSIGKERRASQKELLAK
jgi:hypothetical protein